MPLYIPGKGETYWASSQEMDYLDPTLPPWTSIETNYSLLNSHAVPAVGILPVTSQKNLKLRTMTQKMILVVVMNMIINVELLLMQLKANHVLTMTKILQLLWWGNLGREIITLMIQISLCCLMIVKH